MSNKIKKSIRNNIIITFILLGSFLGIFINSFVQKVFKSALSLDEIPIDIFNKISLTMTAYSTLITSAALIIFVLLAIIISKPLTKSIRKLTDALIEINKGNLDAKVEIHSGDEFEVMADAFNTMAQSLKQSTVSREYMNDIFKSLSELVVVCGRGGTIRMVNSAVLKVLGYRQEELLGKDLSILFEGHEGINLREVCNMGKAFHLDKSFQQKSGDLIPVYCSFSVLNKEQGVVCVARDVRYEKEASRKLAESESLFRSLFANLESGFALHEIVLDDSGEVIDYIYKEINAAFEDLTGLKREKVLGKKVTTVLPDIELSWIKRFGSVALTGNSITFEQYFEPLDRYYSVVSYKPRENCFAVLFNDITERRKQQREQEEIRTKMFQATKLASIGELAAGVGHEINNPLAILRGNLELLEKNFEKQGIAPEIWKLSIGKQVEAIKRISDIVNGLRTYARTDSDIVETICVNESIDSALSFVKGVYEKDGIIIKKKFQSRRLLVDGNSGKLQQVIVNLLSNARDATENTNKPVITIETERREGKVCIRLSDNGTGIPQENLSRIFDQFFTTKDIGRGTGLGMSIVKNLVDNINGSITLESVPDCGTTFMISIPESIQKQASKNEEEALEMTRLKGKVLLVDDEEDIRMILGAYLDEFGLEVDEACNGKEALERLKSEHFDYVVTDYKMPEMDGRELIAALRKLPDFNSKIFVVTGAMEKSPFEGLEISGVINKPFGQDDIYRLFAEAAEGSIQSA